MSKSSITVPATELLDYISPKSSIDHEHWVTFYWHLKFVTFAHYERRFQQTKEILQVSKVDDELKTRKLVSDVVHLLQKAQYVPISHDLFHAAMAETFELTTQLVTDWEAIDSQVFSETLTHVQRALGPHFLPKVVLYSRGSHTQQRAGYFFDEKIQLGSQRLLQRILPRILVGKGLPSGKIVSRRTLYDAIRENPKKNILGKVSLVEPTFGSVVVMFCTRDSKLCLSQFRNVPYADIEALLPVKAVLLRPVDQIMLFIQIVLLVIFSFTAVNEMLDASAKTALLIFGFLSALCMRIYTVVLSVLRLKHDYKSLHEKWLESHRTAAGTVVLNQLVNEVHEQEVKEMLIAVYLLWRDGPASPAVLSAAAGQLIKLGFGCEIEFDVLDAVGKLSALGLADLLPDGRIMAKMTPWEFLKKTEGLAYLCKVSLEPIRGRLVVGT
eukprot:TRINITY_DN6120_c0_g1_i1.p1 TRINITY_DN6120_c0_g1~~TRINITY_DN6120_c0_g1_i1.p1  ORF type:complete len:440 (-),score=50.51 TRINITY_DN6120_c0_g1_i1:100-1419(-)